MVKDKPAGICRTEGDTHMKTMLERGAGILMPVSSLPSPYGIGTFGSAAYEFVDFLKKARQKYWQGRTDKLRGQPVSVVFRVCGESVFYRSGHTGERGTSHTG